MRLLEFLEARLAEDEAAARAAAALGNEGCWTALDNREWFGLAHPERSIEPGIALTSEPASGAHIARHDPVRVLAEVEMKRFLVRLHAPHEIEGPVMRINGKDQVVLNTNCLSCSNRNPPTWPCATIKALVRPYAGHPDCPPELAVVPGS